VIETPHRVLRASAVVLRQECVLLTRYMDDTYWALPGGHIEPGEMSDRALGAIDLRPAFLRAAVKSPPREIRHVQIAGV
jgi:8-oxo-dGTP pyrophosphatase MutT (NUDIX family)